MQKDSKATTGDDEEDLDALLAEHGASLKIAPSTAGMAGSIPVPNMWERQRKKHLEQALQSKIEKAVSSRSVQKRDAKK